MFFRCPNNQAHCNEAVFCPNVGTPENIEFSIWIHGDPTDMRESMSVFQIRTINRSKLDKRQVSVIDSRRK